MSFYTDFAMTQFRNKEISDELNQAICIHQNVSGIQTYYPGLDILFDENIHTNIKHNKTLTLSHNSIHNIIDRCEKPRHYIASLSDSQVEVFCKKVHILDPFEKMKGAYDVSPTIINNIALPCSTNFYTLYDDITSQTNQAYIDALVGTLLSFLTEHKYSPHFPTIYNTFAGVCSNYRYDITQDYETLRYHKWFWNIIEQNGMFNVEDHSNNKVDINNYPILFSKPSEDELVSDNESDGSSVVEIAVTAVHADDIEMDDASISTHDFETESEFTLDEVDYEKEMKITMDISDMPVMLIFQEAMKGTLDELLFVDEYVNKTGPLTGKQEAIWSAWIFQVVAALTQMQSVFGVVHNDLHTNNIMWVDTKEKYIYYKKRDGTVYQVPTHGKLMKIIDFGRASFNWNDNMIFSDDFLEGHDADGQYNLDDETATSIANEPNRSFDLCRFAVSILEGLYYRTPENKKKGALLSQNGNHRVYETVSPLYNLLWSWTVNDLNESVLSNEFGNNRFDGFDLYVHIAAHVSNAVPEQQLDKNVFHNFTYNGTTDSITYPLFI